MMPCWPLGSATVLSPSLQSCHGRAARSSKFRERRRGAEAGSPATIPRARECSRMDALHRPLSHRRCPEDQGVRLGADREAQTEEAFDLRTRQKVGGPQHARRAVREHPSPAAAGLGDFGPSTSGCRGSKPDNQPRRSIGQLRKASLRQLQSEAGFQAGTVAALERVDPSGGFASLTRRIRSNRHRRIDRSRA